MIERRTLAQNQHAHWIRHVIQFSQSVNAQGRITNIVNILTNAISFAPKIALALIQIVDAMIMVRASITVIKSDIYQQKLNLAYEILIQIIQFCSSVCNVQLKAPQTAFIQIVNQT